MNPNPPIASALSTAQLCRDHSLVRKPNAARREASRAGARRARLRRAGPAAAAAVAATLAALSALAGCAHYETQVLRVDPAFTDEALRRGGIVVLGVTKLDEVAQVRKPLTETLERMLRQERADLPLNAAARAESALGERPLRLLLNAHQAAGRLDDSSLAVAAGALRGLARYAVVARVESDAIRYSARSIDPAQTGPDAGLSTLCVTGRDARVLVQVYDLAAGGLAFGAKYVGSSEDSSACRDAAPFAPQGSGISIGSGAGAEARDRGYPDPPPLARSLEEAFRNFARGLPRSATAP
jgi:hypothetical protein